MAKLDNLPAPNSLKRCMLILASLDVILCSEDWLRYHSFIPKWSPNVSLAKIDNGAGDHLFALFAPEGVILKGFDHESALSPHARDEYETWPGIYDQAPANLLSLLEDEAIEKDDATFCIWREAHDTHWKKGDVIIPEGEDDGSGFLLGAIFETPEAYVDWAQAYFEMSVPLDIVKQIYAGTAITEKMILSINPEREINDALQELETLGMTIGFRS